MQSLGGALDADLHRFFSAEGFMSWLLAVRPKTLTAIIAPVLMAGALADPFSFPMWSLSLLFGLLIQIGTNLANDYFDYRKGSDTEKRKGPVRVCQAELISPDAVRTAATLSFCLAFFVSLIIGHFTSAGAIYLGAVSVALGIAYTAGPYALAYIGLGDLFVACFFGPVALGATHTFITGAFDPAVYALGFAPGLLSTALLVVNNTRDIEEDTLSGKRTLAVRFGKRFSLFEYAAALCGAFVIPLSFNLPKGAYAIYLLVPMAATLIWRMAKERDYNKTLALNGALLGLYALFFTLGAAWSATAPS